MNASGLGVLKMSPEGPFEAGSYTTITFKIKIGSQGIKRGGSIKISAPNMGWGEPLCLKAREWDEIVEETERKHNPWKPINTKCVVHTEGNANVVLRSDESSLSLPRDSSATVEESLLKNYRQWRWWITGKIEKDDLAEGDIIEIVYGNTEEHAYGIKVQPWPEDKWLWFAGIVDVKGDNDYKPLDGTPIEVTVLPGPPEKVKAVLPSICQVNEKVSLKTAVLDRNLCPPAEEYKKKLILNVKKGSPEICGDKKLIPKAQEIVQLSVSGPETVKTNPMLVESEAKYKLYWGDLHAQSKYHQWHPGIGHGDSSLTPAELHAYGRDYSMLDFVAITDGFSPYAGNAGWEEIQNAANDFYEPGRYVPFKGWECGMGEQGDKCMIYRSAEIEGHIPKMEASESAPTASHALTLFYKNHKERVLTVPHSFMKYLDWSVLDPELDRIMEIYSCWGSYESRADNPLNSKRQPKNQSAQYILGQGALLGFIADGDSHTGYTGRSLSYSDRYWCQCFKAGITGVYAKELTREGVWDSLYDRYCYGTTGERIILRVDINGRHMGSVVEYPKGSDSLLNRKISVFVAGTDYIRRIDIIKNNDLLYRYEPENDTGEFVFEDILKEAPKTRDCYYVRLFQADGNAAWSSPIWISPENCHIPTPVNQE